MTRIAPGPPSATRAAIARGVAARLDADARLVRMPVDAVTAWRGVDFLDVDACARLIAVIDADRRPSTLLSDRGDTAFRTSESCDMDRFAPQIAPVDGALADLLGLPAEHGETLQGQRYAPGQHFRPHHDYFHEGETYWPRMRAAGGQRTHTAMIYLNDVAEGGATWFPQAGFRVVPRQGTLLVWSNLSPDGSPNAATLHEGSPVVDGVKYIVTKWFREDRWLGRAT